MASQPRAWASVGASKLAWNQSRTAGEKGASGSAIGAIAAIGPHSVPRRHYFDQMFTIGRVAPRRPRSMTDLGRHGITPPAAWPTDVGGSARDHASGEARSGGNGTGRKGHTEG